MADKLKDYKLEPDEIPIPRCPICNEETNTFIRGYWGDIIGCDNCTEEIDSYDWRNEDE